MLYFPILPDKMIDFLYCPTKYIFGIHSKNKEAVYARCMSSACVVDLDENIVETTSQAVKISQQMKQTNSYLPCFPDHYGKKLYKEVSQVLQKAGANKAKIQLPTPRLDEFSIAKIRHSFFKFFVSIFLNYNNYLNLE